VLLCHGEEDPVIRHSAALRAVDALKAAKVQVCLSCVLCCVVLCCAVLCCVVLFSSICAFIITA
jgi:hypothetical protein